jgi:phosphoribosyl-AMP cyclohydrolase / phosphoribosyl-ATP pyrophosphohydrolase
MKNVDREKIDWEKVQGLLPVIVQETITGLVLMLGYMNQEALVKTMQTDKVWFYSRTKERLWMKGEMSGNILQVLTMTLDCDKDTLLVEVFPKGKTCHLGNKTCFGGTPKKNVIEELFSTIVSRKQSLPQKSYTQSLFSAGLDKISLKVAEESLEVIQAAQKQTQERLIEESVDLLYHLFVLLVEKNVNLQQIEAEIEKRSKEKRS